ncbi:MAG: hypothetical protein QM594_00990 [Niabella sp.]
MTQLNMSAFLKVITVAAIILSASVASLAQPENSIENAATSRAHLLKWRIFGPFKDTLRHIQDVYNIKASQEIRDIRLTQRKYTTIDLGKIFNIKSRAIAYALCTITSEKEQELGLLINVDDYMRIWVNGAPVIPAYQYTTGRRPTLILHLNKGANKIIVEVKNRSGNWTFDMIAASPEYIRNSAIIRDFHLSCRTPIMREGDSLLLDVSDSNFIPARKTPRVEIFDVKNKLCLSASFDIRNKEKIALSKLLPGAYRYKLYTDRDTLTEFFCYGDLEKIYDRQAIMERYKNDSLAFSLLAPYIKRFDRLWDDFKNGKITRSIDKRIAWCLYKIKEMDEGRQNNNNDFLYASGLMLRTFPSIIDGGNEYYLLYVPEKVKITKVPIPLAVIVPYVTNNHPFYTGGVIANYDRITYISKLADKYGIAVLWPSARIYKEYNHTPITTKAIVETLEDVHKYYDIDKQRIFLYGDCSGGLFALQTAVRRPDLFAAIAVEGPELTWVPRNKEVSGLLSNDLFNLAENLYNMPVHISHSSRDRKAPLNLSVRLMDSIKSVGGAVYYDSLENTLKVENIKEFPESESMYRIFSFFNDQKKLKLNPVKKIATYAFYNDTIYGIYVNEKLMPGKAIVTYQVKGAEIHLITENVRRLTIDLKKAGIKEAGNTVIICNGKKYDMKSSSVKKQGAVVELTVGGLMGSEKQDFSKELYGPVNKVFLNKFSIVRPAQPNEKAKQIIKMLDSLWMSEYQNRIPVIEENHVKKQDVNLIYLVSDLNKVDKSLLTAAGIEMVKDKVVCKGETFGGSDISFVFYRKESGRDNLYVGTNASVISLEMLHDVFFKKGWLDFELWADSYMLIQGNYL